MTRTRARRLATELAPFLIITAVAVFLSTNAAYELKGKLRIYVGTKYGTGDWLSSYAPSTPEQVEKIITALDTGPGDVFLDIGSGDGRVVLAAAAAGARAIGIERIEDLVDEARTNAEDAGLTGLATFVHADVTTVPDLVRDATDVMMWMNPHGLAVLGPWLEEHLEPGTEVLTKEWPVLGWRPTAVTIFDAAPAEETRCPEEAGKRCRSDARRGWQYFLYETPASDAYPADTIRSPATR